MLTTREYKEQILEEMAQRFDVNHNSLADAYALIWAIDVYASLASFETGGAGNETDFKKAVRAQSEAFGVIWSASNAIKHVERNKNNVEVKSMADIKSAKGPSFHAWYANHGKSAPSVSITMNWNFDRDTGEYLDGDGNTMQAPKNSWKTQYLKRLYRPAIEAIENQFSALQKNQPAER